MPRPKSAVTKIPLTTKLAGVDGLYTHRAGIKCSYERHASDMGCYVVWVGKRYALIEAVKLHDTLFLLDSHY